MGLMQDAVEAAIDNQAEAKKRAEAAARAEADKVVARFKELFGLDATWVMTHNDKTYVKKLQTYGGHYWKEEKHRRLRLQVDDVVVGYERREGRWSATPEVVYLPCPECGLTVARPLGYISTVRSPDDARAELVAKIGAAATSGTPCGRCQAQPCSGCGRPM